MPDQESVQQEPAPKAPPGEHSLPASCRDHVVPRGAVPLVKELFRRFGVDQGGTYAAAVAFFALLSIIPALLVAVAVLAFFLPEPHEVAERLQAFIAEFLPGTEAREQARDVIQQAGVEQTVENLIRTRGIAGLIGFVSLLWAAMQIFVNSIPAMNAAFEVKETRGWLKPRLLALGMLFAVGALFLVSLALSAGVQLAAEWGVPGLAGGLPWFSDLLLLLAALAVSSSMFALTYRFLPNVRITWRQAFIGGLLAAILWEVAKRGFAFYLANWGAYDRVYGALGGLVVLVLWTYYSGMVLLLGAEAASLARDVEVSRARSATAHPAPTPTPRRERARG